MKKKIVIKVEIRHSHDVDYRLSKHTEVFHINNQAPGQDANVGSYFAGVN